jgi:hypothetical protein
MLKMMMGGTLTPCLCQERRTLAAAACQRTVCRNLHACVGLPRLTNTARQKKAPTERSTVFTLVLSSGVSDPVHQPLMIARMGATIVGDDHF